MSQRTQEKNKWNIKVKADFLITRNSLCQGDRKYLVSTEEKEEKDIMSKDVEAGKKKTLQQEFKTTERKIVPLAAWIWVWELGARHPFRKTYPSANLVRGEAWSREECSQPVLLFPFRGIAHQHPHPPPHTHRPCVAGCPPCPPHRVVFPAPPHLSRCYSWLFSSFQFSVLCLCQDLSSFLHLKFLS